jgi:CheY-like chemotaxis protein
MERRRARVLVIDDDPLLRNMMRRALEQEHDTVVVASAKDALERIAAGQRFDLVLCDLMLPGLSGVDFHERVRPIAPELVERVLFTTGGAYTPRAEAFLARTDIRHLEKPFPSIAAFRTAVQEHLRRVGVEADSNRGET